MNKLKLFIPVLFLIILSLVTLVNSLEWTGWTNDSNIKYGIADTTQTLYSPFYMNNVWYMLIGMENGNWDITNLTTSGWLYDEAHQTGLSDIGNNAQGDIFNMNGTWYILYGNGDDNQIKAYNWSGSSWQNDSTINNSLLTSTYPAPTVFQRDNGYWYVIFGQGDGTFVGYNYSNSTGLWSLDTNITGGLEDVGGFARPEVFQINNSLYLISGAQSGNAFGFLWSGSNWQNNTEITNGFSTTLAFNSFAIWKNDTVWYALKAGQGALTGYNKTREIRISIDFLSNTTADDQIFYQNWINIHVNTTVNSVTFSNLTIGMYNSTGNLIRIINSTSKETAYNFTILSDGNYSFNATANSIEGISAETSVRHVILDTVVPMIQPDTISTNKTLARYSLFTNLNFTDENLYSINVSDNINSSIFYITGLNTTSYSLNLTYNVSSYSIGQHTLIVKSCDGHTAKVIPDYDYSKNLISNRLSFYFNNDDYITISPANTALLDTFDVLKTKDRYKLIYTKNIVSKTSKAITYSYLVSSSQKIDIVNDKYNGHLVILGLQKWIDFNIKENVKPTYKINRLDDFNVQVDITLPQDAKTLTFESIGDLNCQTANYLWQKYDVIETYSSDAVEKETQTSTLKIDFTGQNNLFIQSTNITFFYDGVDNSTLVTKTSNTNFDLYTATFPTIEITGNNISAVRNLGWNYSINNYVRNISNMTFHSHTIYNTFVGTCNFSAGSIYNISSVNVSFINEQDFNPIYVDVSGHIKAYKNDPENYILYSIAEIDKSNLDICIYPSNMNLTISSFILQYLEANQTDYSIREYYEYGTSLDNVTRDILVYLIPYSNSTRFFITLTKGFFSLDTSRIKIMKYQPTLDSYYEIAQKYTDTNGLFTEWLILDEKYKFYEVDESGNIISETAPYTASCSASPCTVTLSMISAEEYQPYAIQNFVGNVGWNLSYNREDKTVILFATDYTGTANYISLEVYDLGVGSTTNCYCNKTVYATTAEIRCNLTNSVATGCLEGTPVYDSTKDIYFTANAYISRSPKIIFGSLKDILSQTLNIINQEDGLIFAMLLVVIGATAGAFNVAFGLIIICLMLLLSYMLGLAAIAFAAVALFFLLAIIMIVKMRQ